MKILKLSVVIYLFLMRYFSYASAQEKQYTLSICATFKNEAHFLKEWIEYHLLVGVDHFYLYDTGSTDDYMQVLQPYLQKEMVTLIRWIDWEETEEDENAYQWSLGVQIPAYENSARFVALNRTKWLTFLDVHEFLVSPTEDKISKALDNYEEYPGVILKCDFFNAGKNKEMLPKRKLLIQTEELSHPLALHLQKAVTKMIFKPDHCKGFIWHPYQCVFKNLQIAAHAEKSTLRINHYLNRNIDPFIYKPKERYHIGNPHLNDEEILQILSLGYEMEDQERSIQRFAPELAKKMGIDMNWGW